MSNENENNNSTENKNNKVEPLSVLKTKVPSLAQELHGLKKKLDDFTSLIYTKKDALQAIEDEKQRQADLLRAQEEAKVQAVEAEKKAAETVDDAKESAPQEKTPETPTVAPVEAPVAKEENPTTAAATTTPAEPVEQRRIYVPPEPVEQRRIYVPPEPVEQRRIYVPPEEKKTRVYIPPEQKRGPRTPGQGGQGGYNRPPYQGNGAQGARPSNRPYTAPITPVAPTTNTKTGGKQIEQKKKQLVGEDKNKANQHMLAKKGYVAREFDQRMVDDEGNDLTEDRIRFKKRAKKSGEFNITENAVISKAVISTEMVSVKTLSEKIGRTAAEIVRTLFKMGIIVNINDVVNFETAALAGLEFGVDLVYEPLETAEDKLLAVDTETDDESELVSRPPVVTVMGHVDHGKTSLLDYIRKTNVVRGEAGGITQHIGAYTAVLNGENITFLDTPGHEAFTAMRERGAKITDIAVIVIAADDGIMPQTVEAINHAKDAKVEIIVAITKIDKPTANPDSILAEMAKYELVPEEWGGVVPVVRVSSKTGEGVDKLLETILLVAEIQQLRANPNKAARGTIIEAKLDQGKGPLATVLVQAGTLKVGDNVVVGHCYGKIRTMQDYKGKSIRLAGPACPVSVTGLSDVPMAGEVLSAVESLDLAKRITAERILKDKEAETTVARPHTIGEWIIEDEEKKKINIIIKADVQGSVEALKSTLTGLSKPDIEVNVLHAQVGAINENDVMLAKTASAFLLGFNVRPDAKAKLLAEQKEIKCNFYRVIYEAVDDIKAIMSGMRPPKYREIVLGEAEIRKVYKISGVGNVAGCYVTDGKITRNSKVRLMRDNIVIYEGSLGTLKRLKDNVAEVVRGYECGISIDGYNDIKELDKIECFNLEEYYED